MEKVSIDPSVILNSFHPENCVTGISYNGQLINIVPAKNKIAFIRNNFPNLYAQLQPLYKFTGYDENTESILYNWFMDKYSNYDRAFLMLVRKYLESHYNLNTVILWNKDICMYVIMIVAEYPWDFLDCSHTLVSYSSVLTIFEDVLFDLGCDVTKIKKWDVLDSSKWKYIL